MFSSLTYCNNNNTIIIIVIVVYYGQCKPFEGVIFSIRRLEFVHFTNLGRGDDVTLDLE